jgi:hypothetical protein
LPSAKKPIQLLKKILDKNKKIAEIIWRFRVIQGDSPDSG